MTERSKDCLHNPTLIIQNPLIIAQTIPTAGEGPQLQTQSHSVIRASPPERKGIKLRVQLIWEQLSCHVVYHLGDHVHPLGVSEGVQHSGKRKR